MSIPEINSHLRKGVLFHYDKLYYESLNEMNIAITMIEQIYDRNYVCLTNKLYDISVLMYEKNIYSLASLFIMRAIYLCKKYINDDILIIQLYEHYANICTDGNDIYGGYFLYNKLLTFSELKGYTHNLIKYRENIHIIYMIINQLNEPFSF